MTVKYSAVNLKADPEVASSLLRDGQQLAVLAAAYAPKRTGDGARSIRAELKATRDGPEARVSWDQAHFYMGQVELGNEHQAAESFLRRAANEYR